MRKIAGLLVVSFLTLTTTAQMPGAPANRPAGAQQMTGRLYGRVVDAANKGIDAASVTLVTERMDSATKQRKEVIVGGMLTTANGDFSVENVPVMGRYKLRITGIGYTTFRRSGDFSNAQPKWWRQPGSYDECP